MAIAPPQRQADLLRFISGYQEAHDGVSPSYSECRRALGLQRNGGTIRRMLQGLEERGLIRRLPRRARAIEVLHAPPIPRGPTGEPLYFIRV